MPRKKRKRKYHRMTDTDVAIVHDLVAEGFSPIVIAEVIGCSKATVWRHQPYSCQEYRIGATPLAAQRMHNVIDRISNRRRRRRRKAG